MRRELPKYYVYEIWDPLAGKCRYVGKGHGLRAKNQVDADKQKNPRLKQFLADWVAQGVEISPRIVYRHSIEADVLRKERALIAKYGRENREHGGTLFNITSGGQGIVGRGTPVEVVGILYSTIKEAAEAYGVNEYTLRRRLSIGMRAEEAVGLKSRERVHPNAQAVEVAGVRYKSQSHACRELGVAPSAVIARLKRGWSIDEAFGITDRPWTQSRPVTVSGEQYESVMAAAIRYGVRADTVLARLARGWSTDEAFGVRRRRRGDRQFEAHEIRDIRVRVANGQTQKQIATYYGVNPSTISLICRGESYAQVGDSPVATKKVHAPRLTDEAVRAIRFEKARGKANSTLAKEFRIDQSSVSRICTGRAYPAAGGPLQKSQRRVSQDELMEIAKLNRSGESLDRIAKELRLHLETVRRICKTRLKATNRK